MKRQRQPNFTGQEREILISLVEKYKNIIENKQTDGVTTEEKNRAWTAIAKQFNAGTPNHVCRTEEALKNFYKNLKKDLKKRAAQNTQEIYLTGGGPEPTQFSDSDNKILSLISNKTVFGLKNQFDNDASELAQSSADQNSQENNSVDNFEMLLNIEPDQSGNEDSRNYNNNWKHYKASDLKKQPNVALKNKTDAAINMNNIEIIYEEDLPITNFSPTEKPIKVTQEITPSSTPKAVPCSSRRRPNTIIRTLPSSALGAKYEILVDKKIELAECLKKEHEARMIALELDIQLKQKQLKS